MLDDADRPPVLVDASTMKGVAALGRASCPTLMEGGESGERPDAAREARSVAPTSLPTSSMFSRIQRRLSTVAIEHDVRRWGRLRTPPPEECWALAATSKPDLVGPFELFGVSAEVGAYCRATCVEPLKRLARTSLPRHDETPVVQYRAPVVQPPRCSPMTPP